MKLNTPPIASVPWAVAPPFFKTSILSMAIIGKFPTSTNAFPSFVVPALATILLPLTNTKVRGIPKLLIFTFLRPTIVPPPSLNCSDWLMVPVIAGIFLRTSLMLGAPAAPYAPRSNTSTGMSISSRFVLI